MPSPISIENLPTNTTDIFWLEIDSTILLQPTTKKTYLILYVNECEAEEEKTEIKSRGKLG